MLLNLLKLLPKYRVTGNVVFWFMALGFITKSADHFIVSLISQMIKGISRVF